MTEPTAAMIVFETFLEQDGPQDAKTGDDGEKFRMSERQRVRGTAVVSRFCESRGNLVSNTVMPLLLQNLLFPNKPFRVFRAFRGSLLSSLQFIIRHEKDEMIKKAAENSKVFRSLYTTNAYLFPLAGSTLTW